MKWVVVGVSFFFAISANASVIYYCSDQTKVGIEPENLEPGRYEPQRFKININWQTESLVSRDLYLGDAWEKTCFLFYHNQWGTNLNCMSEAGVSFSINRETLKFNRASIYNNHNSSENQDTISVATGTCEQF